MLQDKRIKILEEKLEWYKRNGAGEEAQNRDQAVLHLEKKNLELQEQILEMENFLADYG